MHAYINTRMHAYVHTHAHGYKDTRTWTQEHTHTRETRCDKHENTCHKHQDMDGVLLDVSQSYRTAILETAKKFGAPITHADINKVPPSFKKNSPLTPCPCSLYVCVG